MVPNPKNYFFLGIAVVGLNSGLFSLTRSAFLACLNINAAKTQF